MVCILHIICAYKNNQSVAPCQVFDAKKTISLNSELFLSLCDKRRKHCVSTVMVES